MSFVSEAIAQATNNMAARMADLDLDLVNLVAEEDCDLIVSFLWKILQAVKRCITGVRPEFDGP